MTATARWVFVRHGESTANATGLLAGWDDVPLTDRGRDQAREAGRALVDALDGHSPQQVVSSDLQRARVTAQLAVAVWAAETGMSPPDITPMDGLRERSLGEWRGLVLNDLRSDGRTARLLSWDDGPPGGESQRALAARVLPVLDGLEGPASTVVFAHGGVIRVVLGLVDGTPIDEIGTHRVMNAVPLVRDLPPGIWSHLVRIHGAPPR